MEPLPEGLPGWLADHVRQAELVREVRDAMTDVRVTVDSADGLVAATVGGRGELIELELDPRIYRDQDSAGLAKLITQTIHEATEKAMRDVARIAVRLLPGRDPDEIDPQFDPLLHLLDPDTERR